VVGGTVLFVVLNDLVEVLSEDLESVVVFLLCGIGLVVLGDVSDEFLFSFSHGGGQE